MTLKIPDGYGTTRFLKSSTEKGRVSNEQEHTLSVAVSGADGPSIDPFGRLRVSSPYTVFDSKQLSGKAAMYFDEGIGGTATAVHDSTDASTTMTVAADGDFAIRQTFMRFNYQPGKGQLIFLTGELGSPVADTVSRIGYFNSALVSPFDSAYDGIWFEVDGTQASVNIGKSGTINKVVQGSWSIDTMDGKGPSGIALDFDKAQIFAIDFEWLGVGRVRMGVVVNGLIFYVHAFNHANLLTGVYMSSPNHSVRYEIRSTGGAKSMKQVCSSIESEGGIEPSGISLGIDNGGTGVSISDTFELLFAVQLKDTALCTTTILESLSIVAATSSNFRWAVLLNPTITGLVDGDFTGVDNTVEVAKGDGTNTVSAENFVLASGYGSSDINQVALGVRTVVHPGVALDGTRDVLALCVHALAGTPETFYGAFNIRELSCG